MPRPGTVAAVLVALVCAGLLALVLRQASGQRLPLKETAIIRAQASDKHLDPALIAAVIYAESKFEPRPSSAGAQGLMQILPATAYNLAQLSGGHAFTASDLATPSVNVAYGSYYLRYLLDHYHGNEMLAVAAYSALLLAALLTFGPKRTDAYAKLPRWRRNAKRPSCLDLITLLRKEMNEHPEMLVPLGINNSLQGLAASAAA